MKYDVALSFAGEDRKHAEALANALRQRNVRVFYDDFEKSVLWGENLYEYLANLYQNQARFCVIFLSKHYGAKLWTNHERRAAQAHAFRESTEYILPVRLDETEIAGGLPTTSYLMWPPESANTIANAIVEKLRKESASTGTSGRNDIEATNVEVNKHRTLDHKFTEVSFNLLYRHKIKVEWFFGFLRTNFILLIDGNELYRRVLYTLQSEAIKHSFSIEGIDCSVEYRWLSGAYYGHIYVGGRTVA